MLCLEVSCFLKGNSLLLAYWPLEICGGHYKDCCVFVVCSIRVYLSRCIVSIGVYEQWLYSVLVCTGYDNSGVLNLTTGV